MGRLASYEARGFVTIRASGARSVMRLRLDSNCGRDVLRFAVREGRIAQR